MTFPETFRIALLACCLVSQAVFAELPRGPVAARREGEFRTRAAAERISKSHVEEFLKNIGDDGLLMNSTAELLDDLRAALETRDRFPWTGELSQADFLRYIVPVRVSGEPIQRYRRMLMEELAEVVKNCTSAEEAALEVNLWLGQRVTFKPTDRREQGVLTTLSCGFGRCGEETIIATAAMRSVGIAARMVYVPFWSHQNDNHAWVEVKIGDRWKYLGACEPEAGLNRAWFDEPVLRAPILVARVSNVDSTEAGAVRGTRAWGLNTSENYFEPCKLHLRFPQDWKDTDELWLSVFNYGGIFRIARLDPAGGTPDIEVGAGEFLLFGRYNDILFVQPVQTQFGTEQILVVSPSLGLPDSLLCEFPFEKKSGERTATVEWQYKLDLGRKQLEITQRAKNDTPPWLAELAATTDSNFTKLASFLPNAPGNSRTLRSAYLRADTSRELLLELLATLSEKDLREVDSLTLQDYFAGAQLALSHAKIADDSLRKHVISPRIYWEEPRAWRLVLASEFEAETHQSTIEIARAINRTVAARIGKVRALRPLDPLTLWNAEKIPEVSARVLACGLLRNAGIPAYITEGEDWVCFHDGEKWLPLYPADPKRLGIAEEEADAWFGKPAKLRLTSEPGESLENWNTFNLAPLNEGWPDYSAEPILEYESKESVVTLFVVPGDYLLTWGARNSRGDVQMGARRISFTAGDSVEIALPLRRPREAEQLEDSRWMLDAAANSEIRSRGKAATDSRGDALLVVVLADHHEPSERFRGLIDALQSESCRTLMLSGPGQSLQHPQVSMQSLIELKIPGEPQGFRNGAPYYRLISRGGMVIAAGNGYRLDIASVISNALAKQ